jgi:3-oxoacyl-(acyl-carrier-protein) synthase
VSALLGWSAAREGAAALEERFPGRWDARRALHEELRPLVQAAADALAAAGWGPDPRTAIVVGLDRYGRAPGRRFQGQLPRAGAAPLRPSEFLSSLPSTPAATLGLLLGLGGYQATLVGGGGDAARHALEHAQDLLALGRAPRVLLAALTAEEGPGEEEAAPFRLGVALCLGALDPARPALAAPAGLELAPDLLLDLPSGYRGRAAPGLLAMARQSERGRG